MIHEWSQFWWKNITGAHYIVEQVVDTLLNNRIAIINVPYDLPWRHDMRAEVEQSYRPKAESGNVIIDQIDDLDSRDETNPVGKFLLDRNGQGREIRNGFREKAGRTIQEYLISNEVLRNRIIWVKGLSKSRSIEWISFVENYHANSAQDGLFVLEIPGDVNCLSHSKSNIIKYGAYISDNDVQLLNTFVLSEEKDLSVEWKQYISVVSAKLCGTDAEVSEWLIRNIDFSKMTPSEAINLLNDNSDFEKRGSDIDSNHILALYRSGNTVELEKRVWSAQIRTLFPLIEIEKRDIIAKYHNEIQRTLCAQEYRQYEKKIEDPFELDIGDIYYLMRHRDFSGGYRLYIPDEEARDRITFLRECRNTIAHSKCCSPEEIDRLISTRS